MNAFVFCYHKIFPHKSYDVDLKLFDTHLRVLKRFFHVLSLDEFFAFVKGDIELTRPSVLISFDDGYVDNFIYAYPLLKKYGLKAVIFPIASRLLKEPIKRKTLFDYWEGKASFEELYTPLGAGEAQTEFFEKGYSLDFLSYDELRAISDVFDVGSHCMSHTKVFVSCVPKDIYNGKNFHYSLKSIYKENLKEGVYIYPSKSSLISPFSYVQKDLKLYFETKEEFEKRVSYELLESKNILESVLSKRVYSIAYPFGEITLEVLNKVKEIYDIGFTTEKAIVKKGQNPYLIPRVTAVKDIFTFLKNILVYSDEKRFRLYKAFKEKL